MAAVVWRANVLHVYLMRAIKYFVEIGPDAHAKLKVLATAAGQTHKAYLRKILEPYWERYEQAHREPTPP